MNLIQCVKMSSKIGQKWLIQNAPNVLTGMSIGLSCISVGWAIPATIKAEKKIREKQEEVDRITALKGDETFRDLTNWEKVKTGWTCYIPTMTALGGSIMCSVFANHVSATRIATLATACSLGEKKLNEYQKAIESLDPESQKKVREKIATDYIDENDIDSSKPIYTHDEAARIVDLFDTVLSKYDIRIPSPEDDEREKDNMIGLYGSVYGDLLENVESCLKDLLKKHTENTEIIADIFSGNY